MQELINKIANYLEENNDKKNAQSLNYSKI